MADAEFAHLETRRHESACCRAAARRCRVMQIPNLNEVLPFLDGSLGGAAGDDKEEKEAAAGGAATTLTRSLERERQERAKLAEELEALEQKRAAETEAFR